MSLQPITVWNHAQGPNPKKVFMILAELGLASKKIDVADPKTEEFTKINPNGRLPAIHDPNTDLTLWESGAIIEYLVATYDKDQKITPTDDKDKWLAKQYLFFQASGQGPYFGQLYWYSFFQTDNPQAKERYLEQTLRVVMVLNNILKDKEYLVGGKCTYADIAFVSWNHGVATNAVGLFGHVDFASEYPHYLAWHNRVSERDSVKQVMGL